MEAFNRILSLFVGLFVLILVMFFVIKRFNLQKTFPILGAKPKPTPTVVVTQVKKTIVVDKTAQSIKEKFNKTTTYKGTAYNDQKPTTNTMGVQISKGGQTQINTTSIPETGAETVLLPLALSGLFGGVYLRRKY